MYKQDIRPCKAVSALGKSLSLKGRQSFPCFQASLQNAWEEELKELLRFAVGLPNESGQHDDPGSITPETNCSNYMNDKIQQPCLT
jgi:hypothetical protein